MAFSDEIFQRCKGRFGNLIQTSVEVMTVVEGSNDGFHGFMKRPEFSQNQGPESKMQCLLSEFSKSTIKKPSTRICAQFIEELNVAL